MSTTNPEIFARHSDTVLCCDIDSQIRLAVSGGIDDTAYVWNLQTKHVIFECSGHKESVTAAAFNLSSSYVATGDLNGYIQVRNTTTGIKIFDTEIDEVNWILWHNKSEYIMLAGTSKGDFWMWNVNDPAAVKIFTSYGSSCTVAKLMDDGMGIIVGYHDGSIRLFDLKTSQIIGKIAESNGSEIISIDISPNKALLAAGNVDSSIQLYTLRDLKLVKVFVCKAPKEPEDEVEESLDDQGASCPAEPLEVIDEYDNPVVKEEPVEEEDEGEELEDEEYSSEESSFRGSSVESLLFSPLGNFLAAANNRGTITIVDVTTQAVRCEVQTGIGAARCTWTDDGRYVAACFDGNLRIFDNNLTNLGHIKAHHDQINDVAYRAGVLVTAGEDKTCRVIKL